MGRWTKIITEYRQTGGDADGDNIVGMRMRMGTGGGDADGMGIKW